MRDSNGLQPSLNGSFEVHHFQTSSTSRPLRFVNFSVCCLTTIHCIARVTWRAAVAQIPRPALSVPVFTASGGFSCVAVVHFLSVIKINFSWAHNCFHLHSRGRLSLPLFPKASIHLIVGSLFFFCISTHTHFLRGLSLSLSHSLSLSLSHILVLSSLVKMRGNVERNQRGAILKDRHIVGAGLGSAVKCRGCTKHAKGGVLVERIQGRLWRQYVKAGLLCFSILFLFIVMLRPDWLPLFSSNETVQLIPPVLHHANLDTGKGIFSGSVSMPLMMNLKEEQVIQPRPKGGLKEVHVDFSASDLQNYSSTLGEGFNNPLGLSKDIKIYVYELPSSFNKDWLKDERCSNHLFAAEVAIHQRLLSSPLRTLEPVEADYFFMPVYVSCNFNTTTGFPSLSHARSVLGSAVKLVSRKMPYWNRSKGRDHIFVATHDYGPCFHTMEDLGMAAGIPIFLRNSVILQTFGRTDKHACQTNNSITIPPYVQPQVLKPGFRPEMQHRDIWAFFRGKIEIHPKNVSGRIYSRGVRSTIWQKFRRNRRFFIKRTRSSNYQLEIQRSVFCLCPLGWAPWSPRIVESVIFGCIPVIIADKIALPYSDIIRWSEISVTVPEKDVAKLGKILDKVGRTNLSTIQENLWSTKYRQALLYMDPLTLGDATWQILELLSRKVTDRSRKMVQLA